MTDDEDASGKASGAKHFRPGGCPLLFLRKHRDRKW